MNIEKKSIIMFLKGPHFTMDLALHFTILVIIYTLMFNFIISKLIQKGLFKVLDNYGDNINNHRLDLDNQQKQIIGKLINEYKTQKKKDLTYRHNRKLRIILFCCISLIVIFLISLVYYCIVKKNLSIKQLKSILLENVLLFLLVAIVEIIFTFNIATRYTSINPKFLANYVYKSYNRYVM